MENSYERLFRLNFYLCTWINEMFFSKTQIVQLEKNIQNQERFYTREKKKIITIIHLFLQIKTYKNNIK